jgi:hypothetical protein
LDSANAILFSPDSLNVIFGAFFPKPSFYAANNFYPLQSIFSQNIIYATEKALFGRNFSITCNTFPSPDDVGQVLQSCRPV